MQIIVDFATVTQSHPVFYTVLRWGFELRSGSVKALLPTDWADETRDLAQTTL